MSAGYITFPQIDPVIFSVGPVSLRWYGLMYLIAFGLAWYLANRAARKGARVGQSNRSVTYYLPAFWA